MRTKEYVTSMALALFIFYECNFSTTGLRLSFIVFEIEVQEHLVIAPSQLHPTCWVYMKVY